MTAQKSDVESTPSGDGQALPVSAGSPIRGFRVICEKWSPPLTTIVRARSASKARFRCWDSARDVGYNMEIGELKVRRAPEYDDAKLIEGRCYGEDYASSILSENTIEQGGKNLIVGTANTAEAVAVP